MKLYRSASGICLTVLVAALAACGGGGGGDAGSVVTSTNLTITGTAATGLAIFGATVTGKCKVGTATATTLDNGTFSLTVTDGQLPCVLQVTNPADGRTKLHTLVSGTGNTAVANITPLTEMITARVLGSEPNVFFAAFDASAATQKVTSTNIATAQTVIGLVFTGTIDTTGIGNFITTPLVAATQDSPNSGNAHDKLLDALKLKLTSAQIGTIATALAGNQTTDAIKQTVVSMSGGGTSTPVVPIANAGPAQSVVAASTVTLDASTSSAATGKTLTYAWTLTSKPAGSAATLAAPTTVKPTFVADVAGSYVASVIVNDGTTASSAAAVTVIASVVNAAPVANAGVAQNVVAGSVVTLDGSASSDANSDPLTYAWTLTSKPAGSTAALSSATSVKPTFTADLAGTYVASLTVNDGKVSSAVKTVTIAVKTAEARMWKSVSAVSSHTLAIKSDGTLWAWGGEINNYGQLGDGTTSSRSVPTQIGSANNWSSVSAGTNATSAIKTDGTLWAWGHNLGGQLGDGTNIPSSVPKQVGTDTNWRSVANGRNHTLAIRNDGTLWVWGGGGNGQLGLGITSILRVPTQVDAGTNWAAVSAGEVHTVAIKTDGTLWAWGWNYYGQLGDGTANIYGDTGNSTDKNIPTQIGTDVNWTSVSAGANHTVAIKSNGTLWAWGLNGNGQLGEGTTVNKNAPIQIGTATNWASVSAGAFATFALKTDGTLWAWGANFAGQLGDGTTIKKSVPIQIGAATTWASVSGRGDVHTVAIMKDGTLWVWGSNGYGQLGDGTKLDKSVPTMLP